MSSTMFLFIAGVIAIAFVSFGCSSFFMVDGSFWTFLAYWAVTWGSIMIIGSVSGVTVLGMEKIPLALLWYVAGAAVCMILF